MRILFAEAKKSSVLYIILVPSTGSAKEQVEIIAKDIKRGWDFSHIYEEIEVKVEESARYANITLST